MQPLKALLSRVNHADVIWRNCRCVVQKRRCASLDPERTTFAHFLHLRVTLLVFLRCGGFECRDILASKRGTGGRAAGPTEADRSLIGRMFHGSRRTQGGREFDIVHGSADRRRCRRA
ncbi:hypothetical protein MRX96_022781 [Rhipicephalus microplus]